MQTGFVMKNMVLINLFAAALFFISCDKEYKGEGGLRKYKMDHNGFHRKYFVYLPENFSWSARYPVIFALHGRFGTGRSMQEFSNFNPVADARGIIMVYPHGYRKSWQDGRGENPASRRDVDDTGFIDKLLNEIKEKFPVEEDSIYVCGMSNGGFMTLKLACVMNDHFAAAASVTGQMAPELKEDCHPSSPIPVMMICGTADPVVPFGGGTLTGGSKTLSVQECIELWKSNNGCSDSVKIEKTNNLNDGTAVLAFKYTDCKGNSEVLQYDIVGGGHTWPGGDQYLPKSSIGIVCREFKAEYLIADFFMKHSRP